MIRRRAVCAGHVLEVRMRAIVPRVAVFLAVIVASGCGETAAPAPSPVMQVITGPDERAVAVRHRGDGRARRRAARQCWDGLRVAGSGDPANRGAAWPGDVRVHRGVDSGVCSADDLRVRRRRARRRRWWAIGCGRGSHRCSRSGGAVRRAGGLRPQTARSSPGSSSSCGAASPGSSYPTRWAAAAA
jgi:hypothetical protein